VPLVATTLAVEGIKATPDEHYLAADTPAAMTAAITLLVQNRARGEQLAVAARQLAVEQYDWRRSAARLQALLAMAAEKGVQG